MKIRILSLILALLMLAIPLVSCKDDEPVDEDTDDTTEEVESLQIVTKGVSHFVIVRDYKASKAVIDNVNALVDSFKRFLNAEIEVRECFIGKDEEGDEPIANEILVGNTNRPESAEVTAGMRSGDFCIRIINGKLVIAGGSDDATASALVRFSNAFVSAQGDKNAVAANGAVFSLVVDKKTADEYTMEGKYSYDTAVMAKATIDSYAIFYANNSDLKVENVAFANALQAHINKECGYILPVKKDVNDAGTDYTILIGDTIMTDEDLIDKIGPDNYYIGLKKTDGGAVLTIIFGENAKDACMAAFVKEMPALSEPGNFNLDDGFVSTNLD